MQFFPTGPGTLSSLFRVFFVDRGLSEITGELDVDLCSNIARRTRSYPHQRHHACARPRRR